MIDWKNFTVGAIRRKQRAQRVGVNGTSLADETYHRHLDGFRDRIALLEDDIANARRDIAALQVELAAATQRANAFADLTEQRIDLIYRQITTELKRTFALGTAQVELESEIDAKLARLFSAGLAAPVDIATLSMKAILSEQLLPGTLASPLTLYGFRLNRERARERGDRIDILPMDECTPGIAVYGPYKRLLPGHYGISAHIRCAAPPASPADLVGELALDVYSPGTSTLLASHELRGNELVAASQISVSVQWHPQNAKDLIEIRLHQRSNCRLSLNAISIEKK
ncbi:MAG: hypothetical protein J0H01_05525 [Rhizobiales bacterium]|nr:hypothetical protein [Hyphomicrobiales bacterium]